jgi:hypothetical protein
MEISSINIISNLLTFLTFFWLNFKLFTCGPSLYGIKTPLQHAISNKEQLTTNGLLWCFQRAPQLMDMSSSPSRRNIVTKSSCSFHDCVIPSQAFQSLLGKLGRPFGYHVSSHDTIGVLHGGDSSIFATRLWDKCEGEAHTPKSGKLESFGTPENLELNSRGQISLHSNVLYVIGKVLKCRCPKWPRMSHSDIFSTSYGQKKGRESN